MCSSGVDSAGEGDQDVVVLALCLEAGELALHFGVGQLGELSRELETVKQAGVVRDRAGAAVLRLVCQEEVEGLLVGDGLRMHPAQGELCQEPLGLSAGLSKRDRRVLPDGDTPVGVLDEEGLGTALRHSTSEGAVPKRGIPEVSLALGWRCQAPYAKVTEGNLRHVLGTFRGGAAGVNHGAPCYSS